MLSAVGGVFGKLGSTIRSVPVLGSAISIVISAPAGIVGKFTPRQKKNKQLEEVVQESIRRFSFTLPDQGVSLWRRGQIRTFSIGVGHEPPKAEPFWRFPALRHRAAEVHQRLELQG